MFDVNIGYIYWVTLENKKFDILVYLRDSSIVHLLYFISYFLSKYLFEYLISWY